MRKVLIITASGVALLYLGIFAFWGHAWDLSDPLLFMLAFPTGKDFINLYAAGQICTQSVNSNNLFYSSNYTIFLTKLFNIEAPMYRYIWSYPPTMLPSARLFAGRTYLPALSLWSVATMVIYLGGLRLRPVCAVGGWWRGCCPVLADPGHEPILDALDTIGHRAFRLAGLVLRGNLFVLFRRHQKIKIRALIRLQDVIGIEFAIAAAGSGGPGGGGQAPPFQFLIIYQQFQRVIRYT